MNSIGISVNVEIGLTKREESRWIRVTITEEDFKKFQCRNNRTKT